jgi:hypothetical protein
MFKFIFGVVIILIALFIDSAMAQTIERVELQRTGCLGSCPIYTLAVTSDGTVAFEGEEYVKYKGKVASNISADDWKFLTIALQRANFFALKDSYTQAEANCSRATTDQPSLEIMAIRGKQKKHVVYYTGCYEPRKELAAISWLADTIDFITNSQQWIGR